MIKLSRNFGQQAAYRAGLDQADGDAVVFLDGDLQDPPEMIPAMVELWEQGSMVVVGRRRSRPERGLRGFLMRRFHDIFYAITGGLMPKVAARLGLWTGRSPMPLRQCRSSTSFFLRFAHG